MKLNEMENRLRNLERETSLGDQDARRALRHARRRRVPASNMDELLYEVFVACEHDLGYFNFDYACGSCDGHRTSVSNDWDDETDEYYLYATVNGNRIEVVPTDIDD